jgi:hypothetical protein
VTEGNEIGLEEGCENDLSGVEENLHFGKHL